MEVCGMFNGSWGGSLMGSMSEIVGFESPGDFFAPVGFSLQWHSPFDNQFPGASVSVVILVMGLLNSN